MLHGAKFIRFMLLTAVLVANTFVIGLLAYMLIEAKQQQEREVRTAIENLALLLDHNVTESVGKIDLTLRELVDRLERELRLHGRLGDTETNAVLADRRDWVAKLTDFRVTDASGTVRYGPGVVPGGDASYADREFFIKHRSRDDSGLIVTNLILGRVSKSWVVSFTRRYNHPDGRFAGVISAAVPVSYFAELLSGLDLGPHGIAVLRDADTAQIARHPAIANPNQQIGTKTFSKELGAIIASGVAASTYHTKNAGDGAERTNTYRRLSAVPFHLVAGMGAEDYLAEWHGDVRKAVAIATIFFVVTAMFAWLQWRSYVLTEKAGDERRIAAVAFESRQGMVVTDARNIIIRVNRTFTELTGYEAGDVVGNTPRLLKSGRHDADFYAAMWQAIQQEGFWQGEIWNRRKNGEVYPEWLTITAVRDAEGKVTHYVGSFFDISQRIDDEAEIRNLAFYDPLTGLANRRLLTDRLVHAFAKSSRSRIRGALLFVDLDRFKELNDTLGHAQGDRLLELVADRLTANVREDDTVARFGGDEFVVLLEELERDRSTAAEMAMVIAEKLRAALKAPYRLQTPQPRDWQCTSSIGVALFLGHEETVETVLARADQGLYAAKEGGRNAVRFAIDPAAPIPGSG
ncbi:MAG: diguanylate cyclase [Proteobacteria bacterium]|nr:diguanylate cyclase [Pseudomonadota bacterium]